MEICEQCGMTWSPPPAECPKCKPVKREFVHDDSWVPPIPRERIVTLHEVPGYAIMHNMGMVEGVSVRSSGVIGDIAGGFKAALGGSVGTYRQLCVDARHEALMDLMEQARTLKANAIVGLRYGSTDIHNGICEIIAYGTAVVVERIEPHPLDTVEVSAKHGS